MANTITITGPTFTNKVGTGLPNVPGMQTLAFWGTGFDGNNNNRATGPAMSVLNGTPTYGTNFVSLGLQAAVNTAIDTNVVLSAAVINSGWTWVSAFRSLIAGGTGILVGTQESGGTGFAMQLAFANATRTIQLFSGGSHAPVVLTQPTTSWHIAGLTYSGGTSSGVATVYDLTDGQAPATYTVPTAASGTTSFHFGCSSIENFATQASDQAFGMIATSPLNATDLNTLAVSVRGFLARRGITA